MKQLTVMVPLMEALDQMPSYAKFMKDLLTKKKKKKPDPGAFTISYTVGPMKFEKSLCYLGASINLMPLAVYKRLHVGAPTPTNMRIVMADRSIKIPMGILHDVLVKVADFILPADFVVLDCDIDFKVPIILGRPLLATRRVLVDLELNELKLEK
ncbi:uncharacterized protein LOC107872016 [Capsicum annuum]|uniref:uncharacterized protein LOC107872016 n=1 Tax=Capsicum annuum TaxID=4072 RepID=UPI0007BF6DC7|nr:uncharacterized protein LOC107872016 [Capsicum annuum]